MPSVWRSNVYAKQSVPHTYEPRHEENETCLRKFPTRPDTSRPAQPQKLAGVLKFRLKNLEILYYLSREQQRRWSDCADLRLFFVRIWFKIHSIMARLVFSSRSFVSRLPSSLCSVRAWKIEVKPCIACRPKECLERFYMSMSPSFIFAAKCHFLISYRKSEKEKPKHI